MTAALAAVERVTLLTEGLVERRPGALVGVSAATIGTVLSVIDGMTASTAAATAVATSTVAIVTLVVRVLLTDIRGLRGRVRELETRESARMDSMDAERSRMADRIAHLEARLAGDEGGGR
jgi:hypothetical protein